MLETASQYEAAIAAERAAFEAMMELSPSAPEYPARVQHWKLAIKRADEARDRLVMVFGAVADRPLSGNPDER
jgi:hypothetical protein